MENRLTSSGEFPRNHSVGHSRRIRQICKESTSHLKTSVIEESSCQCSTTLFWTKEEMKILVQLRQGRSKNMPQILMMDTGHSWDPEKKASGIKDIQPIVVASGIFMLHRRWKISRVKDTRYSRVSPLGRRILKKKNRDTIHFNGEYSNIYLPDRAVHAANQLCIYGAVSKWCGPNFGEASQSRPESARKTSQKFKSNRRISSHWLIFQDYRMLRETECSRFWKISIRCFLWAKLSISVQRRNSTVRSRKEIIM